MFKRRVAVIIFYDEKKKILLQDRHSIRKFGEEWGFFGGGIEDGETPQEAVVRETLEELDYPLVTCAFLKEIHYVTNDFDVTMYAFIAPLEDKLKKFHQKEGVGMKLFSIAQAKKLKLVPTDYLVLHALRTMLV
jgi:8-oxo-dGTP diphosphatase